jgi:dsRNA-specific ribonuclease
MQDINYDLYILNEKNKYITKKFIENMLSSRNIDYQVKNIDIFIQSTVHKSYIKHPPEYWKSRSSTVTNLDLNPIPYKLIQKTIPLKDKSYERLEFLGDSIIHYILAEYFYNRYDQEDEGFMTKLRTKIESSETLATFCKIIKLSDYIIISRYIEKNDGRTNNLSILEDTFEAFIGALHLDSPDGLNACRSLIIYLIENHINLADLLCNETNYKALLSQYCHKKKWADPIYGILSVNGPDNNKQYTVYVKRRYKKHEDGCIVGTGIGSSKKRAEQEAAKEALIKFGEINTKEECDEDTDSIEELSDQDQ